MPPAGFELTISAGKRPHTGALDRAATGTGRLTSNRPQSIVCVQTTLEIWLRSDINTLNAKLNPICPLITLFGAHHILHISR